MTKPERFHNPVFVRSFSGEESVAADKMANDFAEKVADAGGEVLGIASQTVVTDDCRRLWHFVTYRASKRIPR